MSDKQEQAALFAIPQLEWLDADDGRIRGHVNGRPLYRITARPESGVRWWRYEDGVDECRRVDTVETAKALCQIDFERQTASLLNPAPATDAARLAAAEQRVRELTDHTETMIGLVLVLGGGKSSRIVDAIERTRAALSAGTPAGEEQK